MVLILHNRLMEPNLFVASYAVKSAHVVTSIKQSPVLKYHICLVLS